MIKNNLLQVKDLEKTFYEKKLFPFNRTKGIKVLDGVSFTINKGETYGLVGESGSGKTTLGKAILGLYNDCKGEILYKGNNLLDKNAGQQVENQIQVVFQDPASSLNPTMTIFELILEPIRDQRLCKTEQTKIISELLSLVELDNGFIWRYPHELSGGQKQRVGIARALSSNPDLIVLDEPLSALDVIVQANIVNLLLDLQKKLGVAYLFIAHDLEMVRYISHRVGVIYKGKIVEWGNCEKVYQNPQHPYTKHLLSSVLFPDPQNKSLEHYEPYRIETSRQLNNKVTLVEQDHYVLV